MVRDSSTKRQNMMKKKKQKKKNRIKIGIIRSMGRKEGRKED